MDNVVWRREQSLPKIATLTLSPSPDKSFRMPPSADHIRDMVQIALGHTPQHNAMIVYDQNSELACLLSEAYRSLLPGAISVDFDQNDAETIMSIWNTLSPGDLVILIQSTSFRLSRFRIRLELFNRKLKVIEHPHLSRIHKDEIPVYLDSLAYDPNYYRSVGPWLKRKIDHASKIELVCEGATLVYNSIFCGAKMNIGCYDDMKNIGGQFPIGEVFTEPEQLEQVNGAIKIFAFGDMDFTVNVPEKPVTALIEKGVLVDAPGAPESFQIVLDEIRKQEEVVWVRELGFGLNRAFTRTQRVHDIGTYERLCGIHLSLGIKHLQYKKKMFPKKGGFHVDVFVDVQQVTIDEQVVFKEAEYQMH